MSDRERMINALNNFNQAYYALEEAWQLFDVDVVANNSKYPFEKSFDELEITEWVESLVAQLSVMSDTPLEERIDDALAIIKRELQELYEDNDERAATVEDEYDVLEDMLTCRALRH